ncbi:MAG: hypothetical protein JWN21_1799 [Sphingomonas bacterium]|uniref:hypothetical protein n=1 Tax=Sphingomonas bacterium TaxID=1895847 RepID=UPI0026034D59|nr:hypothetical protein [Sphingomonas bacterium]MDB5696256.1 hypothetical protein [Sphingomonas bacterium]
MTTQAEDRASRRGVLALLAVSPAAGLAGEARAATTGTAIRSRAALANTDAEPGEVRFLDDGGRSGLFVRRAGPPPSADPLQGLFVSGGAGHWARHWDGVTGQAEWFGAVADDSAADCGPAIEAALAACVRVQLHTGTYHCTAGIVSRLPGRKLIGAGIHFAGDARFVTQVLVRSATDDVFRMGPDRPPLAADGSVAINALHLDMLVEGIEFNRTVAPDKQAQARGVVVQWCQDPTVRRTKSQDSIVDFAWEGTINLLMEDCRATRARRGGGQGTDRHIGYRAVTGRRALTDINGNASARLVRCIAACTTAVPDSTGLLLDGRFTDHSIVEFETAQLAVGIHVVGSGGATDVGTNQSLRRNANVEIVRPWIDQFASVGLRVEGLDKFGIVRVSGGYFGPLADATACIYVLGCRGAVLLGGEMELAMASTAGRQCRGVLGVDARRLSVGDGITVMEPSFRAFDFANVADLRHRGATVNEQVVLQHHTLLSGSATACVLAPALSGAAGKVLAGVEIKGVATRCTVDVAAIDTAALRGGVRLIVDGKPQGAGAFGAGNSLRA